MAVPPGVPTSFVPRESFRAATHPPARANLAGVLSLICYLILLFALLAAGGIFGYGHLLTAEKAAKDADLAKAEASIDQASIESFVRLQNRLSSGKALLSAHLAPSGLFNLIETLIPSSARFDSFDISVDEKRQMRLRVDGTAASFNALAAASASFASDPRIKDAIFSSIGLGKGTSVEFVLSAIVDPSLLVFGPAPAPASPPEATTTTP